LVASLDFGLLLRSLELSENKLSSGDLIGLRDKSLSLSFESESDPLLLNKLNVAERVRVGVCTASRNGDPSFGDVGKEDSSEPRRLPDFVNLSFFSFLSFLCDRVFPITSSSSPSNSLVQSDELPKSNQLPLPESKDEGDFGLAEPGLLLIVVHAFQCNLDTGLSCAYLCVSCCLITFFALNQQAEIHVELTSLPTLLCVLQKTFPFFGTPALLQ
jgi:hypothetical protein